MAVTKEQVVDYISNMSVLELSGLVKEFEEKFGVSAAAPVAVAGAAVAGAAGEAAEEKTEFNLHLESFGAKKIDVIKIIRVVTGLGLKESSHFLRNIKFSTSLAIIDVHIVSFLEDLGLILFDNKVISKVEYLLLERLMQKISELNGMNLSILDNAIWHYMKYR